MTKDSIIIEDLLRRMKIQDSDLIIVEDNEDTKQATVLELKECFTGDYKEPNERLFYSSKKSKELIDDIKRVLSTYASDKEVKSIKNRIEQIIASNGSGKDTELIDARDGLSSLTARLERDMVNNENMFMKKPYRIIEGTNVSTDSFGNINLYVTNITSSPTTLVVKSKNLLDITKSNNNTQVTFNDNGFRYTQKVNSDMSVTLKLGNSLPKGKYFFFANIEHNKLFEDKGQILFTINNSKDSSAYTEFTYNQTGKFEFNAPKAFDEIKLLFNQNKFSLDSFVDYSNIMLMTSDEFEYQYHPYHLEDVTVYENKYISLYNMNYDFACKDKSAIIHVEYFDNSSMVNTIEEDIKELQEIVSQKRDKCGLIKNYGEYLFFDNAICETPSSSILSLDNDKFMRNGVPSLKVIFNEDDNKNPLFKLNLKEPIKDAEYVSLLFYIDKTVAYYFTDSEPITIYLSSDNINEPEMVNYFKIKIKKSELVQGWNNIKKKIDQFRDDCTIVGNPNEYSIKFVKVEIAKNSGLDNREMYFNSIIFNQKMKPTVLLAFDGIYEEGVEYAYPLLTSKGIPATIFSNNRTTFTRSILETVVDLRVILGWDLGQYGCHPNKELLTHDDNAREQYLSLRNAKEWLKDNLVYDPISYSAPYGNLRPISVPILKDLGYKISKTESTGYCNFFDPKYDFAIPMVKMSNEITQEELINKIQYAIDNDCCICIYSSNVTVYGSDLDMKRTLLESVINFILSNKDKITPMTFSEFYNKCNS